jgi:hypothetical protein
VTEEKKGGTKASPKKTTPTKGGAKGAAKGGAKGAAKGAAKEKSTPTRGKAKSTSTRPVRESSFFLGRGRKRSTPRLRGGKKGEKVEWVGGRRREGVNSENIFSFFF